MAENKKLTEKVFETVVDFQTKLNNLLINIGAIESQKHGFLHELAGVNQDQEKFKKELQDKYGSVNINLKDGSFEEIVQEKEDE
jgi:regulator of replication initiation timing